MLPFHLQQLGLSRSFLNQSWCVSKAAFQPQFQPQRGNFPFTTWFLQSTDFVFPWSADERGPTRLFFLSCCYTSRPFESGQGRRQATQTRKYVACIAARCAHACNLQAATASYTFDRVTSLCFASRYGRGRSSDPGAAAERGGHCAVGGEGWRRVPEPDRRWVFVNGSTFAFCSRLPTVNGLGAMGSCF